MAEDIIRQFREEYGSEPALYRAPGRINLIGEHTDYNGGFVLPTAIDRYTWVAAAPRSDRKVRAWSQQFNEPVEIDLDENEGRPRRHWSDYLRGMVGVLRGYGANLTGTDLMIASDVPMGSGLSSSAALELATGLALLGTAHIDIPRIDLVKLAQRAEHEYSGTLCGIMDQFIVAFGEAGKAILLDCRTLQSTPLIVPNSVHLIICNSMVKHELASTEYNRRRNECNAAVAALSRCFPGVTALRDVTPAMLSACRNALAPVIFRRARHVISENDRVLRAAQALEAHNLEDFGTLMYESHSSLRDDYEVSCAELDLLVEIASNIEGVLGSRMTGGGFGGCTVSLVRTEAADTFQQQMIDGYRRRAKRIPDVLVCSAAHGAEQVTLRGDVA